MQTFLRLLIVLTAGVYAGQARAQLLPEDIRFSYQQNVEPWDQYSCKHERANVGVHEWDVYCKVGNKVHRYGVHLVLSWYPRTIHGGSAYELLYWVTDWTGSRPASDSTAIWFHQREEGAKAAVIEAAQGVENDLSSLRLTIKISDG
jgi:hypothetical protein